MENNIKKELSVYGFGYLAITLALIVAVLFAVTQNWWALVWALLAGSYAALALKHLKAKDRIQQEFRDYVAKTKTEEGK